MMCDLHSGAQNITKGIVVVAREDKIGTLHKTSSNKDTVSVVDSNVNSDSWHCWL